MVRRKSFFKEFQKEFRKGTFFAFGAMARKVGLSFLNHHHTPKSTMNTAILTKTAIALGIVYAVYRFVPNTAVKAAAMGVVGTIVARQIPYVNEALG